MPNRVDQQQVLGILQELNGLDPLKELFWGQLNYERVNQPISRRGWGEPAAKALADDPLVFAGGGEGENFKIIVARLNSDHLPLGPQRPVIARLLRDFPYALFVFTNADRKRWHFVNVKYDATASRRQQFRRISVLPGDRLRTASERISMLDLASIGQDLFGISPLAIQQRHDEAFDVEAVTKKFFADFCQIFEAVAKDIRKLNDWPDDIVEKETQTLLNRLLFLYFIQRKGWLNRERDYLYKRFKEHFNSDKDGVTYYSRFLHPLFMRLSTEIEEAASVLGDVPFLNGGLFDDEYGGQQRQDKLLRRTRMKVGNRVMKRVFDDVLEKYNFTVREDTPLNQDVSIDPEMLGKIFESLVLQLEQSDTGGKTSRHDTGSYYTPRPIVHYLCREALRVCLESRGEARHGNIGKLLTIDAADGIDADERAILDECLTTEQARQLLDDLDHLRACDPAVGSGAFPLGLLHELVNLSRLCETRSRGRDPVEVDVDWLYDTKSRFIQRVIYGVDIQERAVEICKLRLWLSLMVDLDIGVDVDDCSASAFRAALRRKVTPLPNLDYKIRRADSLIDRIHGEPIHIEAHADPRFQVILSRLNEAKQEFYRAKKLETKRKWRFKILEATAELGQHEIGWEKNRVAELIVDERHSARVAELDRAMRELGNMREQIKAANKLKAHQQDDALERFAKRFDDPEKSTFVWQLDFAEVFHRTQKSDLPRNDLLRETRQDDACTGFDLVVGNPPWGSNLPQSVRTLLATRYPEVADYEVSQYFLIRSCGLLNRLGQLAFIIPNTFALNIYAQRCRTRLLSFGSLHQLVDLSNLVVFVDPSVRSLLILVGQGSGSCSIRSLTDEFRTVQELRAVSQSALSTAETWKTFLTRQTPRIRIIERLIRECPTLSTFCDVRQGYIPYRTTTLSRRFGATKAKEILTNRSWHSRRKESTHHLKELQGADVKRYQVQWSGTWVKYGEWVSTYLPVNVFSGPRTLIREITAGPPRALFAAFINEVYVHNPSVLACLPKPSTVDPRFVTAVLNSSIMGHVFSHVAPKGAKGLFPKIIITDAKRLPLPPLDIGNARDKKSHDEIVELVDRLTQAYVDGREQRLTAALEAEIEAKVTKLYGVTIAELKIMDEVGA